jgi:hypothetical protein
LSEKVKKKIFRDGTKENPKQRFDWFLAVALTGLPDGIYIFIPKIPIWVFLGWPWNGKCWFILWWFLIFYNNLVVIEIFSPVLVCFTKKKLATLEPILYYTILWLRLKTNTCIFFILGREQFDSQPFETSTRQRVSSRLEKFRPICYHWFKSTWLWFY